MYNYVGYAIIQLPEILVGFYRKLAGHSNTNISKRGVVSPKGHKMTNKSSNIQFQLTKSLNTDTKSTQFLCYENMHENIESRSNMVSIITKTVLEIQNERFEKLEYKMALLLNSVNEKYH